MSDLKARKGQPVTADKWNKIVDRLPTESVGFGAGGFAMNRVEAIVKNTSGNDRDFGELLVIDTWDGPDGTNILEVPKNVSYNCIDPVWHTKISKLVVLAEPIPNDGYGKAVVSGHCVVRITPCPEEDPPITDGIEGEYVMIDPEAINQCMRASSGIGRVLEQLPESEAPEFDHVLINFRDSSDTWHFMLNPSIEHDPEDLNIVPPIKATLFDSQFCRYADEITLDDPMGFNSTTPTDWGHHGDGGRCRLSGNRFIIESARVYPHSPFFDSQAEIDALELGPPPEEEPEDPPTTT